MRLKTILYLTAAAILAGAGLWAFQAAGTTARRIARTPGASTFGVVLIAAIVCVLAVWTVVQIRDALHRRRIERAAAELETLRWYSDGFQSWVANPLNLPIQNASLDWRLTMDQTEAEPMPDQWQAIRALKFLESRQPKRVTIKNDDIAGLLPAPRLQPVLPAIIGSQRLLVSGGMGSGKTNLLRWIASEKQRQSRVLVIDTHAEPGQWPVEQGAVLGQGRNWAGVEEALKRLLQVMDQRFKDIAAGKVGIRGHEIISVIADEWTMIPQVIGQDVIKEYTKPVLVESRKAGIDFILATHDSTVEALGIKGMGGLIKAFDWIIETDRQDGQYICRVRKPSQKPAEAVVYAAPPLFEGSTRGVLPSGPVDVVTEQPPLTFQVAAEPESVEVAGDQPTDEEQAIIFHYVDLRDNDRANFSYNEVARRSLGSAGGWQVKKIKETLGKWGIETI